MPPRVFDPNKYLTSTVRALQDYITAAFDPGLVEVIPEFPPPESWKTPVGHVVVHLEKDADDPQPIGFGTFSRTTYNAVTQMATEEEATAWYLINFDLGIWAFQEVGGSTARMEVEQTIKQLFVGNSADLDLAAATNGIHVFSLAGGRHITDSINGLPVWRTMDMTLIVRVCGRRTHTATDAIEGFDQAPELVIDGNVPITTP